MNEENDVVGDIDDVPPKELPQNPVTPEAMTEDDWVGLKNDLQELLFRAEETENPAFTDKELIAWLNRYGGQFDRFYRTLRERSPETLLSWHTASQGVSETIAPALMREWVAFRDRQN